MNSKSHRSLTVAFIVALVSTIGLLALAGTSSAREFNPTLEVGLTPYGADGRTAAGAPGMSMTLTRGWNEQPIKDTVIAVPLDWRVNAMANVTRCDKEDLGGALALGNCPSQSDAATIAATIFCNGSDEDNEYCPPTTEDFQLNIPGNAYMMNSREYFSDPVNIKVRDLYVGSQADVDRQSEQDLPVVLALQLRIPSENWVPDSLQGRTISNIYAIMYDRKGDFRIEVAMLDMPASLQIGLAKLKMDFYPGPEGVMTSDPDGTGPQPMIDGSKTAGLLRTPPLPSACSQEHYFDAVMTSWADTQDGTVQKTVTSRAPTTLTGCEKANFGFSPTIGYSPSTTQANAYPKAQVDMSRSGDMSYMSGLTMRLPAGIFGSPYATSWCTPNLNAENVEDVCPSSTKAGEVEMVAALFDNEQRLTTVKGQIFLIPPKGAFDLVGIGVAAKMPAIGSNQIIWLESSMALYGENLDGVEAKLTGMPVEFSIEKVRFVFDGSTGSSAQKPLLINPSHCNAGQMSVEFESEEGKKHTSNQPFTATGCESLPYGPSASANVSDTKVGAIPQIDIVIEAPFGDAATKDATVELPVGFEINGKTSVVQCTTSDAANHSCPASSQIGSVQIVTPLLPDPLSGQIYLAEPSGDDPSSVKEIVTEVQGPAGLQATLKGKMVKSSRGKGFDIALQNLPPFPMTKLQMTTFGGEQGLMVVPTVCGPYSVATKLTSHTGRTVSLASGIDVGGPRCAPRLSARLSPNKASAKADLSLMVRPNTGTGYNSVRKATFSLGNGKKKIKVSTGRSGNKEVGSLKLTRTSGGTTKLDVVTKKAKKGKQAQLSVCKRSARSSKKNCKKVSGMGNLKLALKKGKLTITGLPGSAVRELQLELKSKGKFKLRNPRKKGKVTIAGNYTLGNGKSFSSSTKTYVSGKAKRGKRKSQRKKK